MHLRTKPDNEATDGWKLLFRIKSGGTVWCALKTAAINGLILRTSYLVILIWY
jgi:hypothetical protein